MRESTTSSVLYGGHVGVAGAVGEEQLPLQVSRHELVGLVVVVRGAVRVRLEQPLPLLAPVVLVLAVVVVAGLRDADLEEVRVAEHRVGGRVAAAGVAVDAGAGEVDPRVALGQLLHGGDLVRQAVVAHVAVVGGVERLRPHRRAHGVDLDDDEAELGERLCVAARGGEGARADAAGLRPGVDAVDDRVPLRRIEARGPEEQAVEVGPAVARLDGDGRRRLPAGGEEARDVGLLEVEQLAAGGIAEHADGRRDGSRVAVDEVLPVRRERDLVVGAVRRQQAEPGAVEAHAVEVAEVGVSGLAAGAEEVDGAAPRVDAQHLQHVPVAARDRVLQAAGCEVVQVEVAPAAALGEPDRLVRAGQHVPVHAVDAGLEEAGHRLLEDVAHGAGRGVRLAQRLVAMVARGGDEEELCGVRAPLDVREAGAAAGDVVADRRAVLVRRHAQADDAAARGGVEVDDHALDHRHHAIAGQRVLPRVESRVTDRRVHDVHLAHVALVLLERGDLAGIRRPQHDRAVAARPAGVVRRVAVVLHAVGRELRVLAGREVAHPQVPVADEGGAAAVGRQDERAAPAAAPDRARAAGDGVLLLRRRAAGAVDVTRVAAAVDRDAEGLPRRGQHELGDRQVERFESGIRRRRQRRRNAGVVEGAGARALRRVDEDEFVAACDRGPVPEAVRAVGRQPVRFGVVARDERPRGPSQERLGARVRRRGDGVRRVGRRLGRGRARREGHAEERRERRGDRPRERRAGRAGVRRRAGRRRE